MNNYTVVLKKNNGAEKTVRVAAINDEKASKVALYWEDKNTIILSISKE